MPEDSRNTWGTDESKPPPALKPGPVKQTGVINWCRSQIIDMLARWQRERVVAGRNITIDQTAGGRVIHAQPPQYAVPFHVVPDAQNGAAGVRVGAGYLTDRSQANSIPVTGLRMFHALADAGFVWLDVTTDEDEALSAAVGVGTSLPNSGARMAFTSDPFSYTGSGSPPTQTHAYLILARYYGANPADGVQLRQLVSTHLTMQQVSYAGLPALFPMAGWGPSSP